MKLCFLAAADSIHSHKWIRFFAEKGHEIDWISLKSNTIAPIPGVRFHDLSASDAGSFGIFSSIRKTRRILREVKPDLLHIHYLGRNGIVGSWSGFRPLVLTGWGSDVLFAGRGLLKAPWVKRVLKMGDLLTCDANHMKEAMVRLGAKREKIHIINFGIDTKRFTPLGQDENLRKEWFHDGGPVVISLRNFEPVYDVGTLIRSVPLVLKEVPDAKFVLVGTGSQEAELKALTESLGLSKSVRFLGRIPNADLSRYLCSADVYVSTSTSDGGLASSTAEAMACTLPVVISNTADNRDWVRDGEDGFLFPAGDPQALAEKLIPLLKDEALRKRFGARGREIIRERDDYFSEMEKMNRLYETLKP
jgi:glycosyltransferase involved in cell wall biosynthesis